MKLHANYTESDGASTLLEGDSVEDIAAQLPEDYSGPAIRVYNQPGFLKGWIHGPDDWKAN